MKNLSTRMLISLPFSMLITFNVVADNHDPFLPLTINDKSVPATVISLQDTMISAEVAANIEKIYVDIGQKVDKNSVLATLDCREYTIKQDLALAEVNSLKAQLPSIEARIEAAQNNVAANQQSETLYKTQAKAAQASVQASKADVNRIKARSKAEQAQCRLANINLQRARDLGKRQVISQQEVDKAETEFQAAQAECNAVEPEIISAQANAESMQASASAAQASIKVQEAKTKMADSNIKVEEAEIPALNAKIAAAEAMLNTENLMVSRCELRAPFEGEIVDRKVQLGQRVAMGENAFRIISLQEREITASISESELNSIKNNASTLFFSTPQEKLAIELRAAVGLLDGEAKTREVRFTFNENNNLAIGITGRVTWEKN